MNTQVQSDRFAAARSVADAVLYEGYLLYPYRASAPKNQMRWQFGVLVPRPFSESDGSERWLVRSECLVDPVPSAVLSARMRCLQVQHRGIEAPDADAETGFVAVPVLEVDGTAYVEWDEAVDQSVDLPGRTLSHSDLGQTVEHFRLDEQVAIEPIRAHTGEVVGRIVRHRQPVEGCARVSVTPAGGATRFLKVTVTIENATPWTVADARREDVVPHSLVAVHTMLAVDGGRFVSLFDPPEDAREAAAACHNDGAWPVLIGTDDVVLAAPIILYDHPAVAPESPGDLYDATEIDEILALRVLTLTDEEKSEARATDPRAAAIIDRCDAMSPDVWDRLHGTVRPLAPPPAPVEANQPAPWWDPVEDASVDPWTDAAWVDGVRIERGSSVRLHPSHRSDAQDLFYEGLSATVAGVFHDVDGSQHVAVTIDDDPATGELEWQGRYLFFHPDEVEPTPGTEGER